ncbi:DUF6247 family protein [Kitasatospora sp. NPDC087861]|uniref:DUF6247 family protein n=1 Tax=Kitasatospora sp. NPDC087861 TaxID=3364070 RepID=UPI003823AA31
MTDDEKRSPMSAQPDRIVAPVPPPAAAARLLARIRADGNPGRAERWENAFRRDWAKALEDSSATYDLTPFHDVVRTWQGRLDTTPAVDRFFAEGMADEDGIDLQDVIGSRS